MKLNALHLNLFSKLCIFMQQN